MRKLFFLITAVSLYHFPTSRVNFFSSPYFFKRPPLTLSTPSLLSAPSTLRAAGVLRGRKGPFSTQRLDGFLSSQRRLQPPAQLWSWIHITACRHSGYLHSHITVDQSLSVGARGEGQTQGMHEAVIRKPEDMPAPSIKNSKWQILSHSCLNLINKNI